jgi:hypothetical protein
LEWLDGKYLFVYALKLVSLPVTCQNDTLFAGFDGKLNVLQGDEKNKSNSV